jgi:hypothetical protein
MLDNEVEILRKVDHPNITSLHQVYRAEKMLALVMGLYVMLCGRWNDDLVFYRKG